jgi:hypothetical protein
MKSPKILAALAAAVSMSWTGTAVAQGQACPDGARDLNQGAAVTDSVAERPVVWKATDVGAGAAVELAAEGAVRVTIFKQEEAGSSGRATCRALGTGEAGAHRLTEPGTYFFRVERGPGASGAVRYSLQIKG